jgi:hypothetical protein
LFHIASLQHAKIARAQGGDALVHSFIDHLADDEVLNSAKQRGVFVLPTLSVTASFAAAKEGELLASDERLNAELTPHQQNALRAQFPAEWQATSALQTALQNVKKMHAAGITILAGTDAGNPGTAHGVSLHGELALLVRAGLSPIAALKAATSLTAKHFSLNDRGRIAVGLRADIFLVNGDPIRDINATRAIVTIWKNGYPVERARTPNKAQSTVLPPTDRIISDFEQTKIISRYGQGWSVTTDALRGGQSTANLHLSNDGAEASHGALRISGTIAHGFIFPWAGAVFIAAQNEHTQVDYGQAKTLVFWVKGDGRQYKVMAFSGAQNAGVPPSQDFVATSEWQQIRLPLQQFNGIDQAHVSGFAFTAVAPVGPYHFLVDQVSIE